MPPGYRLQGNAFAVRDAGDAVFEDEVRIGNLGRGPYQTLLDSVAARLQ